MSETPAAPWEKRSWQPPRVTLPKEAWLREPPSPPRFSLLALFGVTTAAAFYCWLLRMLSVYAVVLMLVALVALTLTRVNPSHLPIKRLWGDFLAGIVLPVGCLYFDPGIFRSEDLAMQLAAYAFFSVEMFVLFVWLALGGLLSDRQRAMAAGVMTLGWVVCLGLAIILTIPALIGTIMVRPFAALGLVPLFTLPAYLLNARSARGPRARRAGNGWAFCAGLLIVAAVPFIIDTTVRSLAPHEKPLWPPDVKSLFGVPIDD